MIDAIVWVLLVGSYRDSGLVEIHTFPTHEECVEYGALATVNKRYSANYVCAAKPKE